MPFRDIRTGQCEQSGLKGIIKRNFPWWCLPWFTIKRCVKAVFNKTLFQFFYCTTGDAKRFGNILHFPCRTILPSITEQ